MRFLTGLLIGLAIGFVAAILFAPESRKREERGWEPSPEEEPEAAAGGNHDFFGALRQAVRSLQAQVQEAWNEAGEAAQEAEREMRARYERAAPKKARSRR